MRPAIVDLADRIDALDQGTARVSEVSEVNTVPERNRPRSRNPTPRATLRTKAGGAGGVEEVAVARRLPGGVMKLASRADLADRIDVADDLDAATASANLVNKVTMVTAVHQAPERSTHA